MIKNPFFPEIHGNFGFGCMRLPMQGDAIDIGQVKEMTDRFMAAGFRYFDGKFADKDSSASFWTSDSYDDSRAYLVRATDSTIAYEHFNKNIAASVRCIKE